MTWLQRYRLRQYIGNSIWLGPVLSTLAALGAVPLLHRVETALGWKTPTDTDSAQAVLGTMASAMFTFIVFVSSALLVAVQLASSMLTPRIIGLVFRDPFTKAALIVFTFTFTFTLSVLVRINATVPPLTTFAAAYGGLACLAVFLILIDHVGKTLRPSGALWKVAYLGRACIAGVYPRRLGDRPATATAAIAVPGGPPSATIPSNRDGVVLAFDVPGLVALAQRADCVIELVPQVGDFVALGDPLFRLYQGSSQLGPDALIQSVAVGQERTLEQDPAFAFRMIVDIACKGLSPAINDPTTAVLALDQIHHLLRDVGSRCLDDERIRDRAGKLRLVYRTPDWADYVHLAFTEIRHYGGSSIQIARRLRALLENLIQTLPEGRGVLLRKELELLNRSAARFFTEPEDRALAEVSDSQGVGGRRRSDESVPQAEEATAP
jgi:uncharacterized membrane protein